LCGCEGEWKRENLRENAGKPEPRVHRCLTDSCHCLGLAYGFRKHRGLNRDFIGAVIRYRSGLNCHMFTV
jgi:hypothetical protein